MARNAWTRPWTLVRAVLLSCLSLSPAAPETGLRGIGPEQAQCWSVSDSTTAWEREVPLSDLLSERTGGRCRPVKTPGAWQAKRDRIARSWSLLTGTPPVAPPPLAAQMLAERREEGYRLTRVQYQAEPDDVVSAYLLVPDGLTGKTPAVVACMPTSPRGKDSVVGLAHDPEWWYAVELARRGYVVLAPDVLTTGDRVSPGLEPLDTSAFYRKHPEWSMLGKMLWDHQRGLDFLETLAFVDRERIGAIGWSLGGHNAAVLAAFDGRIKSVVSVGGVMHFSGAANPFAFAREFPAPSYGRVGRWQYLPRLKPYLLAGETPTDWHELQALIAPRPYLDMNAVEDAWKPGLAAAIKLRRLYAFLGFPDRFDYFVFDGRHAFAAPVHPKAYAWLDLYLKRGGGTAAGVAR
jgi:dienelactone hydrolase